MLDTTSTAPALPHVLPVVSVLGALQMIIGPATVGARVGRGLHNLP